MTLKKFLEEKRKQRRDFLVGAGTLISLPFFESLYCNNLYAQKTAPLRVLFGMIWPGVDQQFFQDEQRQKGAINQYAPQSTLDVMKDIKGDTVFHRGLDSKGGGHPAACAAFGFSDNRNSFNYHAYRITGDGSKKGALNVGFDHEAGHKNYRFLKDNGNNVDMHNRLNTIAQLALDNYDSGVVVNPVTNEPMVVQLDKRTQMKKMSLDYVVESIKNLQRKLSPSDKYLLDKHLAQIENIENSLPRDPAAERPEKPKDEVELKACQGEKSFQHENDWLKRHDVMIDILSQSLICDNRRVISIISNNCREFIPYHNWPDRFPSFTTLMDIIQTTNLKDRGDEISREDDTKPNYHLTTHFVQTGNFNKDLEKSVRAREGDPIKFMRKVRQEIDLFNLDFYRRIAINLKNTKDVNEKSVLDNSLIYFGGHMGDATVHSKHNVFSCTIGKGRGTIDTSKDFNDHSTSVGNFQSSLIDKLKNG